MAADTDNLWSIREDGSLAVDSDSNNLIYNSSLNALILSSKSHLTIIDALSGTLLQKSDLTSGNKADIQCIYLPEKDKTIFCDKYCLGVRGDLQGILLLDTALQTPVLKTEDVVKIELPLVEATHLLKTLLATDLSNKEYVDDFAKDLTQGIQKAQDATQGNHKTAKWATVCLHMQHMVLQSVCSSLMDDITKSSPTGQGFPVASAIVDRLGFLLPSSREDIMKEPLNRALMYSEASRRETFANWPHMNYKWALPEPMAQAGFFHHPNIHGDGEDRAMCFTCNVCLVCWEPTDEPWSEHERHSQLCPYIKGEYTQNVPLTVTYATQPAQFHGEMQQQKIACISSTFNEDFVATSTRDGNIVVWDVSHILKKHHQFDIDMTDALVAMKTGLLIENPGDQKQKEVERKSHLDSEAISDRPVQEISLRDHNKEKDCHRPSNDLYVTSLCVADDKLWRDDGAAVSPAKSSVSDPQLSLLCGVTLRQMKLCQSSEGSIGRNRDDSGSIGESGSSHNCDKDSTVQLMNEVNEAVSSDNATAPPQIITMHTPDKGSRDFVMPLSSLVPYIVVVSLVNETLPSGQSSPTKKKGPTSSSSFSSSPSKMHKLDFQKVKEFHDKEFSKMFTNSTDDWLLHTFDDPEDCQIIGYTPGPPQQTTATPHIYNPQQSPDSPHIIKDVAGSGVPNGPGSTSDMLDAYFEPSSSPLEFSPFNSSIEFAPSFTNNGESSTNNNAGHYIGSPKKKAAPKVCCSVIQCIKLPDKFQREHIEVQSITPTIDKQHVIVILSTRKELLQQGSVPHQPDTSPVPATDTVPPAAGQDSAPSSGDYCGGGVLVYPVRSENNRVVLGHTPVTVLPFDCPEDVVTSTFLLPREVEDQFESEDGQTAPLSRPLPAPTVPGHLVVTTASGCVHVLALATLKSVATLRPAQGEKYLSVTYCSGIERLCVCADSGKVKFFDIETIGERRNSLNGLGSGEGVEGKDSQCKKAKLEEESSENAGPDYLVHQPLTVDTLQQMHDLIQFENLMPRFTAVVPPCWSEIQQEQQQRRHPQHLTQQGEATQHTRTWKLAADSGSQQTWDEHILEILLPKPCPVGHVDVKFSLKCATQPNIEVTLLKQNIGSIHRPSGASGGKGRTTRRAPPVPKPRGLKQSCKQGGDQSASSSECSAEDEPVMVNNVLDPAFLEAHNAEILCGPVRLSSCLDLSGMGGLISLASPQLINAKPRSLLLHIKGFEDSPKSPTVAAAAAARERADLELDKMGRLDLVKMKKKKTLGAMYKSLLVDKSIKGIFDAMGPPTMGPGGSKNQPLSMSLERQKLDKLKGCDWLQELSVTVRVFRRCSLRSEKAQRNALLQEHAAHCTLIKCVVDPSPCALSEDGTRVSGEHVQALGLDVMLWLLSVMMNDAHYRGGEKAFLSGVQDHLNGLVSTCLIAGSRSTAHKFSRLLALCMESAKLCADPDLAPAFNQAVLHALLDSLPVLPQCSSSGAMRWFFTLLNRVKCMDAELVAAQCNSLLQTVAQHYHTRVSPYLALLKTRYGLYGNPFEPELFDMDLSGLTKPSNPASTVNPSNVNTPNIFHNLMKASSGPSTPGLAPSTSRDPNLFDMLTAAPDKAGKSQAECLRSDILGLLEVEPLHFRCHATSDGTRMERMDASTSTAAPAMHISASAFQATSGPGVVASIPFLPAAQLHQEPETVSYSANQPPSTYQPSTVTTSNKEGYLIQGLLQAPPPQVLVIERMHSGARRFVTLDFGKAICLTDVVIPSSSDLASLSIDVWLEGEETDGQRLVVASDIGHRTLVMNNIMPAPLCRYLKITTVGRCSGGTTRSRIPLGSFYGHTYILPWEWPSHTTKPTVEPHSSTSPSEASPPSSGASSPSSSPSSRKSHLMAQLTMFLSLQEDLQCRFSLALCRLEGLLGQVSGAQYLASQAHPLHRSGQARCTEEDAQLINAYNECLQLQLQMNLAQRAIHRMHTSLGMGEERGEQDMDGGLAKASTDKLRVVLESLLDTLLASTVGNPSIPQPPASLYSALTPPKAQALFEHLCLYGTQRIQVSCGLLLVRVCGPQPWWGSFLGDMVTRFFNSQHTQLFPQDRVFILLTALGQKSLAGPSALSILDSLLAVLTTVLQPLVTADHSGSLDLSLLSWVLLFLCRNMESSGAAASTTAEGDKGGKKDLEAFHLGMSNRWNFIESQWSPLAKGLGRGKDGSHRYRGVPKRIHQSKAQKMRQVKDKYAKELTGVSGEILRARLRAKGSPLGELDKEESESPLMLLPRPRCLAVVRGLVALLLAMDATCHVDLFLVACKVVSRMCTSCRPVIPLHEAVSQAQLERLLMLVTDTEFNHDHLHWGGPWAAHAITSLMQDILEAEKTVDCGAEEEPVASPVPSRQELNAWLNEGSYGATMIGDREVRIMSFVMFKCALIHKPEIYEYLREGVMNGDFVVVEKDDPASVIGLFHNKSDCERYNELLQMAIQQQRWLYHMPEPRPPSPPTELPDFIMEVTAEQVQDMATFDKIEDGFQFIDNPGPSYTSDMIKGMSKQSPLYQSLSGIPTSNLKKLVNKLSEQLAGTNSSLSHSLSVALDARMELGLETLSENRLRVMQSMHLTNLGTSFSSPLPQPPTGFTLRDTPTTQATPPEASPEPGAPPPVWDNTSGQSSLCMLKQCFEHMFALLPSGRVSLEAVLQLWLTLNWDHGCGEAGAAPRPLSSASASPSSASAFDPCRHPVISLSQNAVSSIMETAVSHPSLPVRSWVFVLQALCLLTNQRRPGALGVEASLAGYVLNNTSLAPLLTKLLSSHAPSGSPASLAKHYQMGPAAVKMLGDLLFRLQIKSLEAGSHRFREMLLKIVYDLTAERGAIHCATGQLDAQVTFVEMLSDSPMLSLDRGNALSVVQAVTALVHQHMAHQDQVVCRSSHDNSSGARTCFGGLVASLVRASDNKAGSCTTLRDRLMFHLLQLVNKMITAPVSPSSSRLGSTDPRDLPRNPTPISNLQRKQVWADHSLTEGNRLTPRLLTMSDDEKYSRTQGGPHGEEEEEDDGSSSEGEEDEDQVTEMADIVAGNPVIMQSLLGSLSHCHSNKLALMFAHSSEWPPSGLHKTLDQTNPLTAGDLVFHVLRSLKERCSDKTALVDSLFSFFTDRSPSPSPPALTRLSEPLLFFTLRTLSSQQCIRKFIELNGLEVVGSNLVRCSQRMVSASPSLVSSLMQSFSHVHSHLSASSKGFDPEDTEGMQSFAHLGVITCSSPTASPADGLIQSGANRRARSATWAYHFYPDEPHVELTIHLPFAVLLKAVHIRPHGAAISTCPSEVSLELSHDGSLVWPASPPLVTSSLALIRIQLQKPCVVTTITLTLHRPLDSMTIGLQKISLCGQTAFADGLDQAPSLLNEDCFSHSSLGWMQLLHHCLVTCDPGGQGSVTEKVAAIPHLLATCTSLLAHPYIGLHATKLERILLVLGLGHAHIGLALIDSLLRQPASPTLDTGFHSYLGVLQGDASPYTVEILYRLATTQDQSTQVRVTALLQWLEDCASATLAQPSTPGYSMMIGQGQRTLLSPAPEHVQCVAAVLWHSAQLPVTYPLHTLVNTQFIRSLYDWSQRLAEGNLRKSVHHVLCSACLVCPAGFTSLQEWMGVITAGSSQMMSPSEALSPGRMTDDSKAQADAQPSGYSHAYSQDGMTDDSKEAHRLHSLSSMGLSEDKLVLLACVSKSPGASRQLLQCGLPAMLAQAVCEFCNQQVQQTPGQAGHTVTVSLVSSILGLFTSISSEPELQDWLGQAEGNAFWSQLLALLCGPITLGQAGSLSSEDRHQLEARTITFFSSVIAFHPENQLLFAKVLCDVIKDQATSKTELLSAMPLSGFMRRLLLQVLLEDERITVSVRNQSSTLDTDEEEGSRVRSFPLASCSGQIFHPRYGSGRSCQFVTMNINAKCSDVIMKVADSLPLASMWSEKRDDKKKRQDDSKKKEVLAAAKEKREKSPSLKQSGLPPRPPTRRGRSGTAGDLGLDSLAGLRPQAVLMRSRLRHVQLPGKDLPHGLSLSQLLGHLFSQGLACSSLHLVLRLRTHGSPSLRDHIESMTASEEMLMTAPFPSALKVFASVGGLALLAEHLPLLFPEVSQHSSARELLAEGVQPSDHLPGVITGDSSDDVYETYLEPITPPHGGHKPPRLPVARLAPSIPPHSLIAFGLFLRLPGYAETLLRERRMAQCLLRLVLGVTDDGDGGQILTAQQAGPLATMPMCVLKTLFDTCPLTTDDGLLLRRMALDIGVVHLVLACLARLSHHKPRTRLTSPHPQVQLILCAMQSSSPLGTASRPEEKGQQQYWAKGTGFGTGSTTSSWDAEQAMLRQKGEEEHVAALLQVLASYVRPSIGGLKSAEAPSNVEEEEVTPTQASQDTPLPVVEDTPPQPPSATPPSECVIPSSLRSLLAQSCLVPALCSYLRNDSVLDMARHVPLYRALLRVLRGIAVSPSLVPILLPLELAPQPSEASSSIEALLANMKGCVDTYASRLKSNKGKSGKGEDEESEGLALLIPDIQETARLVHTATQRLKELAKSLAGPPTSPEASASQPAKTLQETYMSVMKELQFDTFVMVTEDGRALKFILSHHYESNVKAAGNINNTARTRRLAQEAVTLSTSLPLAFSSSVFVRCDEDRLDVMKVLITGPDDTPYMNGCFEFDVFFPQDYPNSPPFINMETTGNHSVRFNPNLYNDGKVCLSILNTWHGRPEEKWNPQTSSFLQVLVSVQSLILVSEPYFNEPGYERSRGTPPGEASSHEYDANIRQATVKWAMLEQLKHPSACFKDIIQTHFWLKRHEVLHQCETWLAEMDQYTTDKRTARSIQQSTLSLKLHYNQLKEELSKLRPPSLLGLDEPSDTTVDTPLVSEDMPTHTDLPAQTEDNTSVPVTFLHTTTEQSIEGSPPSFSSPHPPVAPSADAPSHTSPPTDDVVTQIWGSPDNVYFNGGLGSTSSSGPSSGGPSGSEGPLDGEMEAQSVQQMISLGLMEADDNHPKV